MARTPNTDAINEMMAKLQEGFEKGYWEGVEAQLSEKDFPDWYYTERVCNLKMSRLGYLVGRLLERFFPDES